MASRVVLHVRACISVFTCMFMRACVCLSVPSFCIPFFVRACVWVHFGESDPATTPAYLAVCFLERGPGLPSSTNDQSGNSAKGPVSSNTFGSPCLARHCRPYFSPRLGLAAGRPCLHFGTWMHRCGTVPEEEVSKNPFFDKLVEGKITDAAAWKSAQPIYGDEPKVRKREAGKRDMVFDAATAVATNAMSFR